MSHAIHNMAPRNSHVNDHYTYVLSSRLLIHVLGLAFLYLRTNSPRVMGPTRELVQNFRVVHEVSAAHIGRRGRVGVVMSG